MRDNEDIARGSQSFLCGLRYRLHPGLLPSCHASRTTHHASLSMATQDEPAACETHLVAFVVNAVKSHIDLAASAIAQIDTERLAARFAVRGDVIASLPAGVKQPNEVR